MVVTHQTQASEIPLPSSYSVPTAVCCPQPGCYTWPQSHGSTPSLSLDLPVVNPVADGYE